MVTFQTVLYAYTISTTVMFLLQCKHMIISFFQTTMAAFLYMKTSHTPVLFSTILTLCGLAFHTGAVTAVDFGRSRSVQSSAFRRILSGLGRSRLEYRLIDKALPKCESDILQKTLSPLYETHHLPDSQHRSIQKRHFYWNNYRSFPSSWKIARFMYPHLLHLANVRRNPQSRRGFTYSSPFRIHWIRKRGFWN